MSIFSKVAKGIGGALKGGLGKKILSAIPGVGTAMAIGGIANDVYRGVQGARPTSPFTPPSGPMPSSRVLSANTTAAEVVALTGRTDVDPALYQWELDSGKETPTGLLARLGGERSAINTAGAVPSWGNLGKRAGGVIAATGGPLIKRVGNSMKRWVPEAVGGAVIYKLIDVATGEVLDIRKSPPAAANERAESQGTLPR